MWQFYDRFFPLSLNFIVIVHKIICFRARKKNMSEESRFTETEKSENSLIFMIFWKIHQQSEAFFIVFNFFS